MPAHKGGHKDRKHGRGKERITRSHWKSYAGLIGHQQNRRATKLLRRYCKLCKTQFHSRGAFNRHDC